jgi:hypothetical protein
MPCSRPSVILGTWRDDSTFAITLLDVGDRAPALGAATATVTGAVRDLTRVRPAAIGQSAVLSGNYGRNTPPALVSFVADDPHDLDSVYGAGDILTLSLNMATDRGGADAAGKVGTMEDVDRLFAFSTRLAANYTGEWLDDSTFQIEVLEPLSAGLDVPTVGITEASLSNTSNIRNRASSTLPSIGVPVELTGDFGASAPRLDAFTARAAAGSTMYGAGASTFAVRFDKYTDRGGTHGGKRYVDSLFAFSHQIGSSYSGTWIDASIFEVTIVSTDGLHTPVDRSMRVSLAGSVRNPARTSLPAAGDVRVRTDASQSYFAPPRILEARAIDTSNNDTRLGTGDQLRLIFDKETNGLAGLGAIGASGAALPNRTYVDALLAFSDSAGAPVMLPPGASYSGLWEDTSTFVVTFGAGLGNGSDTTELASVSVRTEADLRTRAAVSRASSYSAPILNDFGSFAPPRIVRLTARDERSAGFDYNRGDELVVTFDRATNRGAPTLPESGGRELVDALLSFSHALGSSYSGGCAPCLALPPHLALLCLCLALIADAKLADCPLFAVCAAHLFTRSMRQPSLLSVRQVGGRFHVHRNCARRFRCLATCHWPHLRVYSPCWSLQFCQHTY